MMIAYEKGHIDGTDYAHSVLRVTLGNGERYALDTTGAQYGWPETVTPWDLYCEVKVQSIKSIHPFGYTKEFCKARAEKIGGQRLWMEQILALFANSLEQTFALWQRDNGSLSVLINLLDPEIDLNQASLLGMIEDGLWRKEEYWASLGAFDLQGDIIIEGTDRPFTSSTGQKIN